MELKRIRAKDMRTAQEKATALYGPDVLVISSCQVRGQTEMIVAVDVVPMGADEALQDEFPHTVTAQSASGKMDFNQALHQAMPSRRAAPHKPAAAVAPSPAPTATQPTQPAQFRDEEPIAVMAPVARVQEVLASVGSAGQQTHEQIRGQEIVSLVREELSALRKEFRLSQQMAMWSSGQSLPPALQPVRQALQDAPIPSALRALLLDVLPDHDNADSALSVIRAQLEHTVSERQIALKCDGVHVVAGPSGSGKTLMLARMAQNMALELGAEQVAVISYCDVRPGAWNQAQLLSTQSGVECFRATSMGALKLLLEDLSHRRVVLIDTAGVQTAERVQEIRTVSPQAQFHAVVPADASVATLRRLFTSPEGTWHSIVVSKIDESAQPWALIQFLSESRVGLMAGSKGDKLGDWMPGACATELVDAALAGLGLNTGLSAMTDIPEQLVMPSGTLMSSMVA
jgi:flagellar biosynthesis GTPase FlhF